MEDYESVGEESPSRNKQFVLSEGYYVATVVSMGILLIFLAYSYSAENQILKENIVLLIRKHKAELEAWRKKDLSKIAHADTLTTKLRDAHQENAQLLLQLRKKTEQLVVKEKEAAKSLVNFFKVTEDAHLKERFEYCQEELSEKAKIAELQDDELEQWEEMNKDLMLALKLNQFKLKSTTAERDFLVDHIKTSPKISPETLSLVNSGLQALRKKAEEEQREDIIKRMKQKEEEEKEREKEEDEEDEEEEVWEKIIKVEEKDKEDIHKDKSAGIIRPGNARDANGMVHEKAAGHVHPTPGDEDSKMKERVGQGVPQTKTKHGHQVAAPPSTLKHIIGLTDP